MSRLKDEKLSSLLVSKIVSISIDKCVKSGRKNNPKSMLQN
jgi:hypothetical protein